MLWLLAVRVVARWLANTRVTLVAPPPHSAPHKPWRLAVPVRETLVGTLRRLSHGLRSRFFALQPASVHDRARQEASGSVRSGISTLNA